MTNNQLTKEWLQQTIAELESVRDEIPFGIDTNSELELAAFKIALAAMDSEPVEPIWGAKKYPVSRPVPGAKLIIWDETGKFVGYGSAVVMRESGVAIQLSDGRRLDSNHELRWQYALQPAPVVQCPYPCGWDDLSKLAIQDAAFVTLALVAGEPATESIRQAAIANNDRLLKVISACRAAMLQVGDTVRDLSTPVDPQVAEYEQNVMQAGNSPVIPDGYVMVPKEPTEDMLRASYRDASVYSAKAYRAMLAAAPQEVK
ncbi:TPA: hypothetical protein ACNOH8_003953 [Klebsiella aerogenes]